MTSLFPAVPLPAKAAGIFLLLAAALNPAAAQAPLTLADAIRAARENSVESRLIVETSARLDAMKRELWAGALPQVQGYANAGRGHQPISTASFPLPDTVSLPPVYGVTQNAFSYGVQVAQPIFSFGRLGQSFRTANRQIGAQNEANRRAVQELELQTLDAFYGAVMAEARLRVIEASLERQGRAVGFLDANFRGGAGSRGTLLLARASLKALEPERIRAERDADAARMNLNRLLGRDAREPLALDTSTAPVLSVPAADTGEARLQSVLDNRPDLAALRLQSETMRGYATYHRMLYLPSLGVQGKVGILAYELDGQLTDFDNNLDWQIGVGLTWNLFDGLSMSSKARQYDSDARSAALGSRQARAFARIEIEGSRREAGAADTALAAALQAREASVEALELLTRDFRAGAGQITDLLAAEEGLRNAETGLLAACYQKARALAALRLALGMNLLEETSK